MHDILWCCGLVEKQLKKKSGRGRARNPEIDLMIKVQSKNRNAAWWELEFYKRMDDLYENESELYKEWATWFYLINGKKTEIDESGRIRPREKEEEPLVGSGTVYYTFSRVPYEYLSWYCKATMRGFIEHHENSSVSYWQKSLFEAIQKDQQKRLEEALKTP